MEFFLEKKIPEKVEIKNFKNVSMNLPIFLTFEKDKMHQDLTIRNVRNPLFLRFYTLEIVQIQIWIYVSMVGKLLRIVKQKMQHFLKKRQFAVQESFFLFNCRHLILAWNIKKEKSHLVFVNKKNLNIQGPHLKNPQVAFMTFFWLKAKLH